MFWCPAPLVQDRLKLWNRWKEKLRLQILTAVNVNGERNPEEHKINYTLREKPARLLLKSNKDAYEEHNRKQIERQLLAKHRKSFAINHPHLDQEP